MHPAGRKMSNAEITAAVMVIEKIKENGEDANVEETVKIPKIPHSEGQKTVETTIQYFDQEGAWDQGSNPGEGMDVYKCIVPLRHWSTLNSRRAASPLVRLLEGQERWEALDYFQGVLSQNWGGTE
ncbi:uncharacterized protein TNCV_4764971 [Trichonephila clavipes]|nr:uncharacterized protein TNCV_4764971 [Trichonephila clavipes]